MDAPGGERWRKCVCVCQGFKYNILRPTGRMINAIFSRQKASHCQGKHNAFINEEPIILAFCSNIKFPLLYVGRL